MATPLGNMVIHLGLDATKMNDSLTKAKNQLRNFDKQLRAQKGLSDYYKTGANAINAYKARMTTLNNAMRTQANQLKRLKADYDQSASSSGQFSASTQRLAGQIEQGNVKLAQYAKELQQVKKEIAQAISSSGFTGFLQKTGQGLQTAGAKMQAFGQKTRGMSLGVAAGVALSVKAASDFDSAFTGVKKTVDETATTTYPMLEKSIRQMAKEIPASTTEIANVAEAAGQLGVKADDVMSFTRVMIDMGNSTNLTAEEAATSLAKFTNITGLSNSQVGRLGATVVDLGNNMATTERDIVEMGLRLAGTGKLVGLTDAQIMGLSAAMSSVGINAEAGGSAFSRVMQKINTNVAQGGEGLQNFANVAGMSAEEFANTWKTKPTDAIVAFLKGLERVKAGGGDVTATLKELGISSTNEIDTLQRLAGAGDLTAQAFDRASKAFEDGTALTTEAEKRYDTFASKVQVAKNKVKDIAIELGGPLLEAFSSALDAGEPFIKMLADLAKRFAEADPETQRFIMGCAGVLAALSPVSSILGTVTGGVGRFIETVGKVAGFVKAKVALHGIEKGIEAAGAAAGGATGSVGGFSGSLGLLTNPLGLVIGGTAALAAGLVYLGNQKDKARIEAEKFGTTLDSQTKQQVENFKTKVDETKEAVKNFGSTSSDVDKVKTAFADLQKAISDGAKDANAKLDELGKKWGLSDEQIAKAKAKNDQIVKNTQSMTDQINAIYDRHNGDARKFSEEEKAIIVNNQNEMIKAKLQLMNLSGEKQKAVMKALNGDIKSLNETQLKDNMAVYEKMLKEENKLFEDNKAELKRLYDSGAMDYEEYHKLLQQEQARHNVTAEALGEKYVEIVNTLDSKIKARTGQSWNYWEEASKKLAKYGMSFEELSKKAAESAKKTGESTAMLAKYTSDMTQEAKDASDMWTAIIFDEKTGKLKADTKAAIQEALASENGWANMQFIVKNANLTTNARATVAEALVANGQWDSLTPEDKKLVVDGKEGLQAIFDSKANLETWNSMPEKVKQLLLDNKDVMSKADVAKAVLEGYNALTPEQKKLLAEDEDVRNAVSRSTETLKQWDATNPLVKDLKINSDNANSQGQLAIDKVTQWNSTTPNVKDLVADPFRAEDGSVRSIEALNRFNQTTTDTKQLNSDATGTVSAVTSGTSYLKQFNDMQVDSKSLTAVDQTQPSVAQAQGTINSLTGVTRDLNASNKTGAPKAQAQGTMNSLQNVTRDLNASNKTGSPKAQAQGTMNSLQNVTRSLNATDRTHGGVASAKANINSVPSQKTSFIDIITRHFTSKHAKGTNNHPGGLAMVNDQVGSTYKELITLPNGESFIPEGRNVVLPLPKGTKVLTASKTKRLFPNYADGVGYSANSPLIKGLDKVQSSQKVSVVGGGMSPAVMSLLSQLISQNDDIKALLDIIAKKSTVLKHIINGREYELFVEDITDMQAKQARFKENY